MTGGTNGAPKQDMEAELPQLIDRAFQLAVDGIDSRVKKHSLLYKEVVAQLECVRGCRSQTWGRCQLAKDYPGWARAQGKQDKPALAFTIAIFRAHDVLCQTRSDFFSRDSEKRGLRAWMEEQFHLLEIPQPAKEPKTKRKKEVKIEKQADETFFTKTSFRPDAVLLSIERDSPNSTTSPSVGHSNQRDALSGTNLSIESKPSLIDIAPAKRRKIDYQFFKPVIVMRDAETQTDTTQPFQPAPDPTSDSTETISSAFKDAIAQQTEALGQAFHKNMQQIMFQGDVEEGHPHNVPMPNLRPLPAPRQPAMILYDQQGTTSYHNNESYEIERPMGQRVLARQVTRVMEKTPAFDVESFRYVPSRRTFKREFEY